MSDSKDNQAPAKDREDKAKASGSTTDLKKSPQQESSGVQNTTARSGNLLAIIALLIAAASIAGSYILWRQLNDTRQQLTNSDEQTTSTVNAIQPKVTTLQTKLDSLEAQLDARLDQELKDVDSKQQLLQESLQSLQTELGKEQSGDWVLAEAEYLMRIANNRLLLERDISTAVAALSIADSRLREVSNPALIDVRKQLSDEITTLEAIEYPDISGMGLTLHSLQERVALLPIKGQSITDIQETGELQHATDTNETSGWRKFLNTAWTALKSLVTIRRIDQDDAALIPPEQRDFLKQNLRLQLETARLALFRNDELSYHSSLGTASDWLTRYFNTDAGSTASMLDSIERLNGVEINPPLPDISGSLNTLNQLLTQKSASVIKQRAPKNPPPLPPKTPPPAVIDEQTNSATGNSQETVESGDNTVSNTLHEIESNNVP